MWKYWLNLFPSLLVGVGIIVAALVARLADGSGWWIMTAPALLAVFVVCADLFEARLKNGPLVPSLDAVMMAGAFPAVGSILALRDPGLIAPLIPIFGAACYVPIVSRAGSDRRACRYL